MAGKGCVCACAALAEQLRWPATSVKTAFLSCQLHERNSILFLSRLPSAPETCLQTKIHRENVSAEGFRFAIVASRWNDSLTSKLLDGALEALKSLGAAQDSVEVFRVPGAFELPLASLKAAETGAFDAVIAIGVVIRGETPHFDYVAGQAAAGITNASLQSGIPIMFAVVTTDTLEQAIDRAGGRSGNKGYEAAAAAVEVANLYRSMKGREKAAKG
jgi:6,7-dimethyl-8-ribityllumazine synthase